MVETATALNAEARAEPGGAATSQLGYLLGAAERGAEESEGIHSDLVRRLVVAARFAPGKQPLAAAFLPRLPRRLRRRPRPAAEGRRRPACNTLRRDPRTSMEATTLTEQLWGGETTKAVDNFPVSGERVPVPVVRWLGRIKAAAAEANGELGELDGDLAERIADAGKAIAEGEHDDQFPIDVFQTGSGTSSNMNANEVIANLAGEGAHPNDHVNMGQSSNDVFPSAVHLAALDEVTHDLLPAMGGARGRAGGEGGAVRRRRQGRPHPPDGRGPGHPRPGVRRLRGAGPARRPAGRGRRCAGSARSRSAAPPPAPASTPIPSSPPRCASSSPPTPAWRSPARSTPSRRRATATRWSSSRARSRSTPSRSTRSPTTWR